MSRNNFDSTNSTFKAPIAPVRMPQPTQAPEALLFNDIMEDKTTLLRNTMVEFLQVQPYRKFEFEFSNFLKRVKGMIEEGHRNGANASRLTNISHIAPMYSRPSMSFNCRPPSTISMFPSNQSSYQLPETNYPQRIEPLNPFKPPSSVSMLQPKLLLSRIEDDTMNMERSNSSKLCATIIEMGQQSNNVTKKTCNEFESHEDHVSEKHQDTAINKYSDMTIIENGSVIENNNSNNLNRSKSLESELENVGFKIVVGKSNKSTTLSKKDHSSRLDIVPQSQLNSISETLEKFLSKWSVNVKEIKTQKKTKVAIVLSGTLLAQDKVTVLEKSHDAGILESRKEKNLIKTKNGLYRLLGDIISGFPKNVFTICLETGGIPSRWRILLSTYENTKRESKKPILNFSLESPAGPVKLSKPAINMDVSMTRKGTSYGSSKAVSHKDVSNKRKLPECDTIAENSKSKHRKFQEPLLASTPKRPKIHHQCATPSEILKSKLCRKLNENQISKPKTCKTLNTANDSIVVKKRQSYTKDENIQILRPPTPIINNNTYGSKSASSEKSVNHTKSSRSSSVNSTNLKTNSSSKQSKSRTMENSAVRNVTNKTNSSQTKHKTSVVNSTASTLEHSKKLIIDNSILKKRSNPQNENIVDSKSKTSLSNSGRSKLTKKKPKEDSRRINSKVLDEIPKNICRKNKKKDISEETSTKSISGQGLFDNFEADDFGDISDFNVMQSPGKLSMISRTDKSRSETPPLFNQQWMGTSGKSIVISEPPTPLSKSAEAKALRRVKRPEITEKDELKEMKRHKASKKKQGDKAKNYDAVNKMINDMLVYGEQLSFDDEMISYSS